MNCLFCKIISGEIPCYKIYEDEVVIAFLDINPDCDGHTLIIPKEHYKDVYDISDEVLLHVYKTARKLGKEIVEKLGADGFSLLQNNGSVQEIKHYHLHIKPHYNGKDSIKTIKNKSDIDDPENVYKKIKDK